MGISYQRRIDIVETFGDKIATMRIIKETFADMLVDASLNGFGKRVEIDLCIGCDRWQLDAEISEKIAKRKAEFEAVFVLAGIPILRMWELPCQYDRKWVDNPWYLIQTSFGLIEIGWRKRVISIDWSNTGIRTEVTNDNVTKEPTYVHAWSVEKAVEYLKVLASCGLPVYKPTE